MNNSQKGFSASGTLLIAVIIGLVGFVGWYVWNKNSESKQVEEYKRITSVPNDWKTYDSDEHKFSISYPANWKIDESSGTLAEESTATNKNYFGLRLRPYPLGPDETSYGLEVTHETLEEVIAEQKRLVSLAKPSYGIRSTGLTITEESRFTYDGHEAIRFYVTHDNGVAPGSYSIDILISANGRMYRFVSYFSTDDVLLDHDVLTVFESLKIK